jgi:hypothetical protein
VIQHCACKKEIFWRKDQQTDKNIFGDETVGSMGLGTLTFMKRWPELLPKLQILYLILNRYKTIIFPYIHSVLKSLLFS